MKNLRLLSLVLVTSSMFGVYTTNAMDTDKQAKKEAKQSAKEKKPAQSQDIKDAMKAAKTCDLAQLIRAVEQGGPSVANARSTGDDQPLFTRAAKNGCTDIVVWLAKNGADVCATYKGGKNALKRAEEKGDTNMIELLKETTKNCPK